MDVISIIALIVAIIALIVAIVGIIYFNIHKTNILDQGIAWKIQPGVGSGTTDVMKTGGNNLYIGASTSPLTLTINPDPNNITGSEFQIFNNSTNDITIVAASGISLNMVLNGSTVASGQLANFIATGANQFLRVE